MTTDGALLALIVDDDDAIRVLAAWGALGRPLDALDDPCLNEEIAAVAGVSSFVAKRSLVRLRAARVLVDGGISELADKMLQSHVQSRVNGNKRGKR